MADENTIKEYLLSLGFKIDEPGLKRFNNSITSMEKNTVKFATTMAAATTAVITGVAEIAKQFTTLYYVSERTGATVENINALTFAGQQIGLTAGQAMGALEGLARTMRMNPGIAAYINSMGIKTAGRDTSAVLTDIVGKLKQMYGTGPGFAIGARIGQMLGIDPDTLLFLEKNYDELLRKQEASRKYYRDAGVDQQKAAGQSRELINAFHDLEERLEPLGVLFETILIPYLMQLIGLLNEMLDWFDKQDQPTKKFIVTIGGFAIAFGGASLAAKIFTGVLRTLGITAAAEAAEGAGLWLLLKRLGAFAAILTVFHEAGLLSGSSGPSVDPKTGQPYPGQSPGPDKTNGGAGASTQLNWGHLKRRMFGAPAKESIDDIAYFMSQGWTREQAIGIVANIQAESGGDPNAYNPAGGGRGARGIAQWRGDRISALIAFAAARGTSWDDRGTQLAFYDYELKHGQGGSQLAGTTNIAGATGAVLRYMERPDPKDFGSNFATRLGIAQSVLDKSNKYNAAAGGNLTVHNKTDIHLVGGASQEGTAKAVAKEQINVNASQTRNAAGLFNQ